MDVLKGEWTLMDEDEGEREWIDRPGHLFIVRQKQDGWYWQGVGEHERFPSYFILDGAAHGPFLQWQEAAVDCEASTAKEQT